MGFHRQIQPHEGGVGGIPHFGKRIDHRIPFGQDITILGEIFPGRFDLVRRKSKGIDLFLNDYLISKRRKVCQRKVGVLLIRQWKQSRSKTRCVDPIVGNRKFDLFIMNAIQDGLPGRIWVMGQIDDIQPGGINADVQKCLEFI
ncbi:MAG: hypothetical protein KDN19_23315 [Verrucomicrobiae bacterium]|nr:hypothetical protein [Verrucomicrobiae bacterium]